MFFIGIDLGTSAVKLLLMDEHGGIKNTVSEEYPIFYPKPGWSEQAPADWWAAVKRGIRRLTAGCERTEVAGISFGARCSYSGGGLLRSLRKRGGSGKTDCEGGRYGGAGSGACGEI